MWPGIANRPVKMGSIAQWKPATSADPRFGRPPNVELDFPENLAETTHGATPGESRDRAMEMGTKPGNRQDLVERKALARQCPDVAFDAVHCSIESLLIQTPVRSDCNGTAHRRDNAAQPEAGGEIQFFKQSSGRPLYCSRISQRV